MKTLKKYKYKIIFLTFFLTLFVTFSEVFGYKLVVKYFNTFQKTICFQDICINKVKDWIPVVVKVNNENYILNILNEKFIPFQKKHSILKDFKNGILLIKDNSIVRIVSQKEYKFNKNKTVEQYIYKGKTYFFQDSYLSYTIYYPQKKIFLELQKTENDNEFLKNFLEIN